MRQRAALRCPLDRALALAFVLVLGNSTARAVEPGSATYGTFVEEARHAAAFGITQANNVSARLSSLHRHHARCDRFDIRTNMRWQRVSASDEDRPDSGDAPRLMDALLHRRCNVGWAVWAGGDIDFGFLRASAEDDRGGVRTPGLTLGADRKLADGAIVGAAIGYARSDWNGDGERAETRARGENAMLYTTFEPWPMLDVDAVIGVGELAFDSRRLQPAVVQLQSSDRSGSQMFGSLGLRADLIESNVRIAPYARYDLVRNELDAYGERASAGAAPVHGDGNATESVLVTGIFADVTFTMAAITVSPALRVEQRRVRSDVGLRSSADGDAAAPLPASRQTGNCHDDVAGSLTVPVRFGRATSIALEYMFTSSSEAPRTDAVRALLQTPF